VEEEEEEEEEEEKPKKFQFIHSLNKYNIRYGVFMYIIHFQRNMYSRAMDCGVKKLSSECLSGTTWRAHSIDCTQAWLSVHTTFSELKKRRREKFIRRLYSFVKSEQKSCTYRHIDVFISRFSA
jgi:hypothetical protein